MAKSGKDGTSGNETIPEGFAPTDKRFSVETPPGHVETGGSAVKTNGVGSGNNSSNGGTGGSEQGQGRDAFTANPNTLGDANIAAGPGEPKRRGRPPGSKNRTKEGSGEGLVLGKDGKKPFVPNDREKLLNNIQAIHGGIAILTKTPEFMLSPPEATALSTALADVLDKYHVNMTGGVSPELALIFTGFMIYRTRVPALIAKRKQAQEEAQAPTSPGDFVRPHGGMYDLGTGNPIQ